MPATTFAFSTAPSAGGSRGVAKSSISELALHAFAQLPPSFGLRLGSTPQRAMLERVARAYGIQQRLSFEDSAQPDEAHVTRGADSIDVAALLPATMGELVEKLGDSAVNVVDPDSSPTLSGHRVVVVTNYPAHYRLPLFERMAERLGEVGAQLNVVFLSADAKSRPWLTGESVGFDHETTSSFRVPVVERGPLVPVGLRGRLRKFQPTIILAAGFSPVVTGRARRIAEHMGSTFGVWSGETLGTASSRSPWREHTRRHLLQRADFAIAYGARAARYIRDLAPDLPLVIGRNTSPVGGLPQAPTRRGESAFRFVLIGDLATPRKGADVAVEAMRHVSGSDVCLDIVGDGRLRATLASRAARDPRIRLLGALGPDGVARKLGEADALLFPTRSDIFGLVLVEAMGARVVPVVSRAAGAVEDLAVDGANAIVVDGHDPAAWGAAMERLTADPAWATALGSRAQRTIESRWTIGHAAEAMLCGLRLGVLAGATP